MFLGVVQRMYSCYAFNKVVWAAGTGGQRGVCHSVHARGLPLCLPAAARCCLPAEPSSSVSTRPSVLVHWQRL